ncbi:hypothetical protein [Paracoccus sphaerophysae]|uniref:hypothetical protein n=1 Tax=Paracoccus sphaerophysae TaxID=690417 RepID=UPI0012EC2C8C|nr:hypothetical protein [Paracoccus sphaerophysae]
MIEKVCAFFPPENCAEWIGAVGSFGQFLVVALALLFTICQVSAWRKQRVLERRAELADDILLHAGKFKEELLYLRRPFNYSPSGSIINGDVSEYEERLKEIKELEPLTDLIATARTRQEFLIDNPKVESALRDLIETERDLKHAFGALLAHLRAGPGLIDKTADPQLLRQYAVAVEKPTGNDLIRAKLVSGNATLKAELKTEIRLGQK